MKILLLSDTHGYLDPQIDRYIDACDEVWHAGDIGDVRIASWLEERKPLQAVYGNIDGREIRERYPEQQLFQRNGLSIYIIHITGYPRATSPTSSGRY